MSTATGFMVRVVQRKKLETCIFAFVLFLVIASVVILPILFWKVLPSRLNHRSNTNNDDVPVSEVLRQFSEKSSPHCENVSAKSLSPCCRFVNHLPCPANPSQSLSHSVSMTFRNVSQCTSNRALHDLERLEEKLKIINRTIAKNNDTKNFAICANYFLKSLCLSTIRTCTDKGEPRKNRVDVCEMMRDPRCNSTWTFIRDLGLLLSKHSRPVVKNDFCPALPRCICVDPFIRTQRNDTGQFCSPKCFASNWSYHWEFVMFQVTIIFSAIFCSFLVLLILITSLAVKELRSFPQCTLVLMCASFGILVASVTVPLIIGQKRTFCSYEDTLSSYQNPTRSCTIQGIVVHFGVLSMLAWWFFSIVNVAVSVCTLQTSNPLRRHPTLFFSLEIFAAIAFPIGCILAVFARIQEGPRYSIPGVVVVVCAPPINTFFYTFVLPIQVVVTVGIIISYITVVRLQRNKVSYQKWITLDPNQTWGNKVYEVFDNLQRRFLLHVILYPILLAAMAGTTSYFLGQRLQSLISDAIEYLECLQRGEHNCIPYFKENHPLLFCITVIILLDIFAFSFALHILMAKPASAFWSRIRRQVKFILCHCGKRKQKQRHHHRRYISYPESESLLSSEEKEMDPVSDMTSDYSFLDH